MELAVNDISGFLVEVRDSRRARWCIVCEGSLPRSEPAFTFTRDAGKYTICPRCMLQIITKAKEAIDELSRCGMEKIVAGCKYRWDCKSPESEVCGTSCIPFRDRYDYACHIKPSEKTRL